ncbi:PilN domain-containing protein [Clostridium sp. BL-8]|uniref:PilN domain-containing protein n=1 Tax=Clostridium sp. BL-8 TaxID=349938 RepID=UPI00098BF81E|nr:PilN domain-containing protein [Clostridium sp. BL-8]OOM71677.1 fimbrial assembly protein PilN [Clostridium sp. BL-8]
MKDLNFFEPYLGKKKEKVNLKKYVYGAVIIVALSIIISFSINTTRIILLNKSISNYNDELSKPEIQTQLKEADEINKQIDVLNKYDKAVNDVAVSVKARDNVSEELLKDISSTLPSEVLFENLDIAENTIAIKGTTTNRKAVSELEHNLRELPIMEDVYVNSIEPKTSVEEEYSFDIKCVLKDVE